MIHLLINYYFYIFNQQMKKLLLLLSAILFLSEANAQFNNLWIPDTISGTTLNLTVKDTFAQFRPGNQSITAVFSFVVCYFKI